MEEVKREFTKKDRRRRRRQWGLRKGEARMKGEKQKSR